MNATKRPWKMQEDGTTYKRWNIVSEDPTWGLIAHIRGPRTHPEVSENAKLIVRAVNSFDAMREALETLMKAAPMQQGERNGYIMGVISTAIDQAKAALALAKGSRER